ncbi:MAG: hypothetical protein A2W91_02745 [Bacteroidetes bacterium GWF2_38_335]|nr:MAG: hypothetical protein A2W91_02745 [Bacteroidetes bacterium GWF2_38_335]OFY77634.1 MAG: hypothetical protein A2281_02015 [Bacteroidetes bacterium RIFOXYA12_FULL_38_20]
MILAISQTVIFAQSGTLSGKISDAISGDPVVAADVVLIKGGFAFTSAKTDASGKYEFTKIVSGTFDLKVTHKNYKTFTKSSITLNSNQSTKLDFVLEPKAVTTVVITEPESKEETITVSDCNRSYEKVKCTGGIAYSPAGTGYYAAPDDAGYVDFNTEDYDKINENVFKEVLNDPLSTFSVDVDRAAYSNVRRFLNQNTIPHKDVVRIEEMINYFDYEYPQPKDEHPFSVNTEMHDCPWNPEHELVMIGIQGEELQSESIPACNLTFLIDVSGSMDSPEKLPLLKQAFKVLVENLRPQDRVAIVVYAGAAGCVLESTPGTKKETILASLNQLQAGGSTAGGAGINLAYKIAMENFVKGGNNRVILATDGDFNIGASSNAEMVSLIEEKRKSGVFLTILGFGMGNYKDSRMEQISNAGNGNYAYIDNILEAKKMFGKELWGTLYTIAKDVKIQIEFNPAQVKAYRLIGYENRLLNKEDFNNDKKDAGEIGAGHTVTALYELIPSDSKEDVNNIDPLEYQTTNVKSSGNLMTVKLRYKEPDADSSKLIACRYKRDDIKKSKISENFKLAASVASFGMLLRDSENKGTATYEATLAMAKDAKGEDKYGYREEYIKLVEIAELLKK